MDIQLSVALNTATQQRDLEVQAGDNYRVIVDVFADENDSTVDPISLTGKTLTFERVRYPTTDAIAVGNTFTFDPGVPAYAWPRVPYRIVMTDADGLRTTLCYGNIVTRGASLYAWGLYGNDYGWGWGYPV
jgi:hypothetical protein